LTSQAVIDRPVPDVSPLKNATQHRSAGLLS
jgi:hypothetical protein